MNVIPTKYISFKLTFYFQRSPRLFTIKSHHRSKGTTAVTEYRERERDGWELHCSKRVDNTSDGPKLRVWYGFHNAVSSANVLRITHYVKNVAVRLAVRLYTHHFPQLGFTCGTHRRRLNCFLPPPPKLRRREGLWSTPAKQTDRRKYYLKFVDGGEEGWRAKESLTPVPVESEY